MPASAEAKCYLAGMTKRLFSGLFLSILILFAGLALHAQSVTVLPETREVEGLRRGGMTALVEFDKKTVEKAWTRFLKEFGKVETWKSGAMVVLAANQTLPEYKGMDLVSRLDATTQGTKVFLSLGAKGDYAEPGTDAYEKAKTQLLAFCKQIYRDDISVQIDAAEKQVDDASKTHDKTVQMGEQLKRKLERNQDDQVKLQKEMEEKKADAERLKAEIQQNKIDQESALDEIKKVRKIAEEKKAKLGQF